MYEAKAIFNQQTAMYTMEFIVKSISNVVKGNMEQRKLEN